jgi:hypothetical protein
MMVCELFYVNKFGKMAQFYLIIYWKIPTELQNIIYVRYMYGMDFCMWIFVARETWEKYILKLIDQLWLKSLRIYV